MNKERIDIIFKMLSMDLVLNDNNLKKQGFSEEDISKLMDMKVIVPTDNGMYKLYNIERLHSYGVRLLREGNVYEANRCFRKCYSLEPNNRRVCLQHFLSALLKSDYDEVFKTYDRLITLEPERYMRDYNLYLLLLSVSTELDEKYVEKVKNITYKDVMLPPEIGGRVDNNIRDAILKNKYVYAFKQLNAKVLGIKKYSVNAETVRYLLVNAMETDKQIKRELFVLATQEKYNDIISMLEKYKKQRRLTKLENYTFLLTKAIVDVIENNTVKEVTVVDTDNMFEAIIGNNFELALSINKSFLELNNEDIKKDIVNILLVKLNDIIAKIKENNKNLSINNDIDNVMEVIEEPDYIDSSIKEAYEIAYYIKSENMNLQMYAKSVGLLPKYILLIKLIYARDYYIDGNYDMGDKLVKEVENSFLKDGVVSDFLSEVKFNRDNYKNKDGSYTRKLVQQ